MAAPESAPRSSSAADSYIGSLISLTSKSEIRYEGVLYNINTDESSIGLRNVRSFGTEGRKKDGPQIAPSDQIYEYILFRGSDIKDLQVKSSPPVQAAQPTQLINNDPAIIQSHYTRPAPTSTTLPSAVTGPLPDISSRTPQMGLPGSNFQGGPLPDIGSQTPQMGLPGSNFQGGLPLYQPPGGNLGPWGGSPPPSGANGGLLMPMYWPGYYGPGAGLQHMTQQSLFRPPTGLSMQQPMMSYPPSLSGGTTSSPALTSTSVVPLTLPPAPPFSLPSETLPSAAPIVSAVPTPAISGPTLSAGLLSLPPLTTSTDTSKPDAIPAGQPLAFQTVSQTTSLGVGASSSVRSETSVPSLVTPGQLLQSGPALVAPPVSSAPPSQAVHKDVEVVHVPASSSELSVPVQAETQPPILPLPTPTWASPKPNGTPFHNRHSGYRGRGRGPGSSRLVAKFTEDFDFIAMNDKFNKDEVWGHLSKISNPEDGEMSDEEDIQTEDVASPSKPDAKPVYNKDDFFDSLSSHAVGNDPQNGRTKYSEQIKIDTETFGEFSRYRGGRGWRGGRGRGGYYGKGYGYNGRGRGCSGALQSHTN